MAKFILTIEDRLDDDGAPTGMIHAHGAFDPPLHEDMDEDDVTPAQLEGAQILDRLITTHETLGFAVDGVPVGERN